MFACAAFTEQVRSDIRSETAGILRQETAGREGVLVLGGSPAGDGLMLTAWYDSLTVWRESPEGRLAPDTDGLLGGQWRGRVSANGSTVVGVAPFVPEEIAEVAELQGVLEDFLPRLPERVLRPGAVDSPSSGRAIRRLGDGAGGTQRYSWVVRGVTDTAMLHQDTVSIPLRRRVEEEGSMEWDPIRGPLRWERRLTLEARVSARGPIRRGINSVIVQQIRVARQPGETRCR